MQPHVRADISIYININLPTTWSPNIVSGAAVGSWAHGDASADHKNNCPACSIIPSLHLVVISCIYIVAQGGIVRMCQNGILISGDDMTVSQLLGGPIPVVSLRFPLHSSRLVDDGFVSLWTILKHITTRPCCRGAQGESPWTLSPEADSSAPHLIQGERLLRVILPYIKDPIIAVWILILRIIIPHNTTSYTDLTDMIGLNSKMFPELH